MVGASSSLELTEAMREARTAVFILAIKLLDNENYEKSRELFCGGCLVQASKPCSFDFGYGSSRLMKYLVRVFFLQEPI
jgi:hypothetical protein